MTATQYKTAICSNDIDQGFPDQCFSPCTAALVWLIP